MTPEQEFYFKMGAIDCLELFARAQGDPKQALMKRMYVQEKMIPDVLPGYDIEKLKGMVDEIMSKKITEDLINKYVKPKVEIQHMQKILKQSQFTDISSLR